VVEGFLTHFLEGGHHHGVWSDALTQKATGPDWCSAVSATRRMAGEGVLPYRGRSIRQPRTLLRGGGTTGHPLTPISAEGAVLDH